MMRRCLFALLFPMLGCFSATAREGTVDFNRDVRVILSDNCFRCHGPNGEDRKAGLRLDVREEAVGAGAIMPEDPEGSELLARVTSDDPYLVMPPPDTEKELTEQEIETLRRWIAQGADYAEHWAFTPPRYPELPDVGDPSWIRNPIDRFVLAKMEQRGMTPSPQADPVTLARRLHLDLIGLPPTPSEVDAFVADPDPQSLADALVDSPHFGERWARWWLDAARYADSDGYEKDKPRSVWFYRDWVINAMNRDMPYDEFIVQQIAGDLMPGAGQAQRVATGFLRNSMVNEEGGADPEQFRVEAMFDRMDAIGKSILGITTQCAQCHTHKYDPMSQREYYQMYAALNDFHDATMSVYTPSQARRRDEILDRIDTIESELKRRSPDWKERIVAWEKERHARAVTWRTAVPTELPYGGQKFRLLDDGSILSESYAPTRANNTFSLEIEAEEITAFRLDALTHPELPRGGPGRSIYGTGALTEFEVSVGPADKPGEQRKVTFVRAMADVNPQQSHLPGVFRQKNADEDNRVTGGIEYAIDGDHKTAWTTDIDPGRRNRDRHAVFVPKEPIRIEGPIQLSFTLRQLHGGWNSDDNQNYLLGRYRFSVTDAATIPETTVPSSVEPLLEIPAEERSAAEWDRLFSHWRTTVPDFAEANREIETLWKSFPETDTQLVAHSRKRPRETFVMLRGDFLNPGEAVEPGTPEFLHPMPQTGAPARLRLARWLASERSPTTARVIVNRIWQAYFGRGLVTTPEDFGFQSDPPTHPKLLDWLAMELMEHDWSLKHIHRLIVRSATYQQSSKMTDADLERDRYNKWLARGPRFRVGAEIVRDIALSVSGLLEDTVGGRSVYPPAPDFLFEPPASYGPKVWDTSGGGQQYRRSLYVHRYRSVPYPTLELFDAPKGDAACVRRPRSNTPLQALVVLNEPQFVECARALAGRVLREAGPGDAGRLRYAHRLCVSRVPDDEELAILQRLLDQQRERIADDEVGVDEIVGVRTNLYRQLTGMDAEELAPWIVVSRALLNLDETITKP